MTTNGYASRSALQSYRQAAVEADIAESGPHRLIQLMFEGAVVRVAAAAAAMEAGETARKGELIGQAIDLVDALRASLDLERGGELAANLAALYEYMERRLLEANLGNQPELLAEVGGLLRELAAGWRAIAPSVATPAPASPGAAPAAGNGMGARA